MSSPSTARTLVDTVARWNNPATRRVGGGRGTGRDLADDREGRRGAEVRHAGQGRPSSPAGGGAVALGALGSRLDRQRGARRAGQDPPPGPGRNGCRRVSDL